MNDSKISVRYAKALFKLAISENLLEIFFDNAKFLLSLIQDSDINNFLNNQIVRKSQKLQLIENIKQHLNPIFFNFLVIIIQNDREQYLKLILLNFIQTYYQHKNISLVDLTTAVELNQELVDNLKNLLSQKLQKQIQIQNTIKPEIIGGFIAKVDDLQIDVSVKSQLNNIRKQLKTN